MHLQWLSGGSHAVNERECGFTDLPLLSARKSPCLSVPSTVAVVMRMYCSPFLRPSEMAGMGLDVELSTVRKGPWCHDSQGTISRAKELHALTIVRVMDYDMSMTPRLDKWWPACPVLFR
jgi:hypothetical protein